MHDDIFACAALPAELAGRVDPLFDGSLIRNLASGRAPVASALIGGALGFGLGRGTAGTTPATNTTAAATATAAPAAQRSSLASVPGAKSAGFLSGEFGGIPMWGVLAGVGAALYLLLKK